MASPSSPYAQEHHIAQLAVLRASILTKKVLSQVSEISKADASPVTVADFAAQALLISAIHAAFPEDTFLGEEDAAALRADAGLRERVWDLVRSTNLDDAVTGKPLASPESAEAMLDLIDLGGSGRGGGTGRFWVMDPIDGTATFLRGEQYAVSLALMENGKEALGVLGCPNLNLSTGRVSESLVDKQGLGLMLSAVKGQGSTIRTMTHQGLEAARPLPKLQGPKDLKELHVIDSHISKTTRNDLVEKFATSFGAPFPGTDVWSSHIRYAALIVGAGDVIARIPSTSDTKSFVWDHAGAQLILHETGGKTTDLDGKEIDFTVGRDLSANRGLLMAKGDIHGKMLERLAEIMREDAAQS